MARLIVSPENLNQLYVKETLHTMPTKGISTYSYFSTVRLFLAGFTFHLRSVDLL